jgi:hypothetical protein
MELDDLAFLLSDQGQQLLAELAARPILSGDHLHVAERLRQKVDPARVHALLETSLLRQMAVSKFSRAGEMYFTRPALEQASAEIISRYRAGRYQAAGFGCLADLGCSIGGDSLALATGAEVIGVDWDPVRLAMAQENVRVYGHSHRFHPLQADLLELSPLPVEALFADPGRRDEHGRRIFSVHEYSPPISFLDRWRDRVPHQAIKVSPGIDYAELPADIEVEFISVHGQVREGVLWFGDLRSAAGRRATLLPEGYSLTDEVVGEIAVSEPAGYLYEPDGAVIRAHLVEQLAHQLQASKIDPVIAYLTSDGRRETPFARCYRIDDWLPFQLKELRRYLRQRNIGQVVIKKRGSPIDPDMLRRRLRLAGSEQCVVFLTQVKGEPMVLVGQICTDEGSAS